MFENVSRQLRAVVLLSAILVPVSSAAAGFLKDWSFGGQCAIAGSFCVAILYVYVVWTGRVIAREKTRMESDNHEIAEEAGRRAATSIQIGSLVKSFCFAVFLILAVVVFDMDVFAALIGFSLTVVSTIAGALFVKTEPAEESSEHSEVEKEC